MQKITPFLWFDHCAEKQRGSMYRFFRIQKSSTSCVIPVRAKPFMASSAGTVKTVAYELDGQTFTAINGGPVFTFNEADEKIDIAALQQAYDHS